MSDNIPFEDHALDEHIKKFKEIVNDKCLFYCEICQKHIYISDILEDILNRIKILENEVKKHE